MLEITAIEKAKEAFHQAYESAYSIRINEDDKAAFAVVILVKSLREILSDEIMDEVFMPLMNTKVGFLTDRNGRMDRQGVIKKKYDRQIVKDAIIDAVCFGLLPTGNQFNIISERMYPTKEGYTALLKRAGIKSILTVGSERMQNQIFSEIPVKIDYEYKGEKNSFSIVATVKKDSLSSTDQLRGKAERRAKKQLYEFITGCDLGDADEDSSKAPDKVVKEDQTGDQKKKKLKDKITKNKLELA